MTKSFFSWDKLREILKIEKPNAASLDEWDEWETTTKEKYPVRYWITEELPYYWYRFVRIVFDNPVQWVRFRTYDRHHIVKIQTIEPGWRDKDSVMLHACFQLLVDFVEIELARMNFTYDEEDLANMSILHRIRRYFMRLRSFGFFAKTRDPAAGVAYLEWEINDENCKHGTPGSTQSDRAREKLELYRWWTQHRANRIEPWSDESIWDKVSEETESKMALTPERKDAGQMAGDLEAFYDEEDQEMLLRLIAVRKHLWS